MTELSTYINLCYGAFFKVLSAFKKDSINDWQLHNRLMNIEDVPFGIDGSYPVGTKNIIQTGKRQGEEIDNPFQTISDFSNCQKTKTLPIQRPGSTRRFLEQFLLPETHKMILEYIQTQVVRYLDEHENLARAIIEMLVMASDASVPLTAEFYIDIDPSLSTTRFEIIKYRNDFNIATLICGVFHYIVENCTDNTVGNRVLHDKTDQARGIPIKGWEKPALMRAGIFEGRTLGTVTSDLFGCPDNGQATASKSSVESPRISETPGNSQDDIDFEHYNLFVVGFYEPDNFLLNKKRFIIPVERALREYISKEVATVFLPINEESIAHIKRLPSIFACENSLNEHPQQEAFYGYVTDIKLRENGYNIYFRKDAVLSQKSLNNVDLQLAISKWELSRTHWTIKRMNLLEELAEVGIALETKEASDKVIIIPKNVTKFNPYLLNHLTATKIIIHEDITDIDLEDLETLAKCKFLEDIITSPNNPRLRANFGALLSIKTNSLRYKLVKVPSTVGEEYRIGTDVDEIGSMSFYGCNSIKRVVIPESVEYIHGNSFRDCTELEEVVIKGSRTFIAVNAFSGCFSLKRFKIRKEAAPSVRSAIAAYNCEVIEIGSMEVLR